MVPAGIQSSIVDLLEENDGEMEYPDFLSKYRQKYSKIPDFRYVFCAAIFCKLFSSERIKILHRELGIALSLLLFSCKLDCKVFCLSQHNFLVFKYF